MTSLLARIPGTTTTRSGLLLAPLPVRRAIRATKTALDGGLYVGLGAVIVLPWAAYLAG